MLSYNKWAMEKHPYLHVGWLVENFGANDGYKYGMLAYANHRWAVIYHDGYDWLEDIYTNINHIAEVEHPAYLAPDKWDRDVIWTGEKANVYSINNKRYVSIEDLEEELGYDIRITNDDKEK